MLPPTIRSAASSDLGRGVAELAALVEGAERALVETHVNLVMQAPGPAVLLWGPDATCLAFNRHFRAFVGMRPLALGRPLFKAHPELERPWRAKVEQALHNGGVLIEGAVPHVGGDGIGGGQATGWLTPVVGADGVARGVVGMFLETGAVLEPMRRLVGAVAHDLREPVVGIQVVSERLARLPKPTRERCVEDMERIGALTRRMDRMLDDMAAFTRRAASGGSARISFRAGDLAGIVRAACDPIGGVDERPVRVFATEIPGLWDETAIRQIVTSLVASACQSSPGGEIAVDVAASREGGIILIKDDGPWLREDDLDQLFEPWTRGRAPDAERRRKGATLGLFLARELVTAHGGRITTERSPAGGCVVRVVVASGGVVPESDIPRPRGAGDHDSGVASRPRPGVTPAVRVASELDGATSPLVSATLSVDRRSQDGSRTGLDAQGSSDAQATGPKSRTSAPVVPYTPGSTMIPPATRRTPSR